MVRRFRVLSRRTLTARVAAQIRAARLASGLTIEQVAERLNKTPTWVSAAEKGRRCIYIHELPQIAAAVDIDVFELLKRAEVSR